MKISFACFQKSDELFSVNKAKLYLPAKQVRKKTSFACFPFALQSKGRFSEPLICLYFNFVEI
jgi:hypothetical protein